MGRGSRLGERKREIQGHGGGGAPGGWRVQWMVSRTVVQTGFCSLAHLASLCDLGSCPHTSFRLEILPYRAWETGPGRDFTGDLTQAPFC